MLVKQIILQSGIVGAIAALALLCTSCQTTPAGKKTASGWSENKGNRSKSKAEKEQRENGERPLAEAMQIPIGTVHMVDQDGKFVLIRSSRTTSVDPDTQIITYGPDATMSSHLKISPARKGAYLTADLVDGIPSVGDMVMIVHTIRKPSPAGFGEDESGSIQVQVLE